MKSKNEHSQVTSTSKKRHYQSQKGSSIFQIYENSRNVFSQDQKERKTASNVKTFFFGQKITTAQIRSCKGR